ncbi:hypothetical protein [Limosilactobacillus equigenerosi]|uniref:hypothetical protein n=1 Tax=Limosilactobacillus equigenerosi TaxID=417373 RepID=UPI000AA0ABD8|nr:hypothetical protein [Limosilactobacillus equigenerosi]
MSGDKFTDYRLKFQISFFKMVAIREEKRGKFMAGMNVQNIILDGLIIVGCYVFEWLITKLTETPLAMLQKKVKMAVGFGVNGFSFEEFGAILVRITHLRLVNNWLNDCDCAMATIS